MRRAGPVRRAGSPLRAAAWAATLALAASGAASCTGPPTERGASPSTPSTTRPATSPAERPTLGPSLRRELRALTASHRQEHLAVAVGAVGGDEVTRIGPDTRLVAWSTIKVPLALAAIRAERTAPERMRAQTSAALTRSDNEAAARLWAGLGDPRAASRAVEEVLADGRDPSTRVPTEVTAAGYSPFGQAVWPLADQARFTAALPCLPRAAAVLGPMARVRADQRWGLGAIPHARIKGGWGQTPQGYVVRQLALVPVGPVPSTARDDGTASGDGTARDDGSAVGDSTAVGEGAYAAVSLQVRASSYAEGVARLDEVAAVIARHRADLPGGRCA